jgi:hypothetical protein
MLYGKLGRIGIYPLQDAFRRMRIPQTAEGVATVRSIINRLQPRHPGRWYFEHSQEMRSPAAIVDTFLHRQDVAYNVQELLNLVEGNGLKFQGWLDGAPYNIGFPDQNLESLCKDFPDRDRWSIVENLTMLRLPRLPAGARQEQPDRLQRRAMAIVLSHSTPFGGFFPVDRRKIHARRLRVRIVLRRSSLVCRGERPASRIHACQTQEAR